MNDIHEHFEYGKVVMSFSISFVGAYITSSLVEQLRAHYLLSKTRDWIATGKWFVLMGVSLGGISAWCMHIIGLSAVTLENEFNQRMEMRYNIGVNIMSLLIVCLMTTLGMVISSYDPLFMKTKGEILEMFIQDTSQLSLQEIRKLKNTRLLWLISTKSLGYLCFGGFLAGAGIVVMHYTGMAAMHWNGFMTYKPEYVVLSIVIAMVSGMLAFWILFRVLSLFPNKEWLRVGSSFLMAISVCGMHYSSMRTIQWELSYIKPPHKRFDTSYMSKREMLYPVVGVAVIVCSIVFIFILADLRRIANKHLQSKLLTSDGRIGTDEANTFNARFKIKPAQSPATNIFQIAQSIVSPNESLNDSVNRSISGRFMPNGKVYATPEGEASSRSAIYNNSVRHKTNQKAVNNNSPDGETSARRKSSLSGRIAASNNAPINSRSPSTSHHGTKGNSEVAASTEGTATITANSNSSAEVV